VAGGVWDGLPPDGLPGVAVPQTVEVHAMPAKILKEFLDEEHARYVAIVHSKTFTAQEIAASAQLY